MNEPITGPAESSIQTIPIQRGGLLADAVSSAMMWSEDATSASGIGHLNVTEDGETARISRQSAARQTWHRGAARGRGAQRFGSGGCGEDSRRAGGGENPGLDDRARRDRRDRDRENAGR